MRKQTVLHLAFCTLCLSVCTLLLAGCQTEKQLQTGGSSTGSAQTLNLSETYSAEDGFQYPSVTWGMTIEETEEAIGQDFGDAYAGSEEEGFDYRSSTQYENALFKASPPETVTWEGMTGDISYQFKNGQLWAVGLLFDLSESPKSESDLESLTAAIDKVYGDQVVSSESENDAGNGITAWQHLWSVSHEEGYNTNAILSAVISDGEISSIGLDFSRFSSDA